jgi:hypothetical protein
VRCSLHRTRWAVSSLGDDIRGELRTGRDQQEPLAGPVKDEVMIISAANGLALDSTVPTGDIHPVIWEPHGESWQRWRLEAAPDGIGFLIKSPHNGNYLTLGPTVDLLATLRNIRSRNSKAAARRVGARPALRFAV